MTGPGLDWTYDENGNIIDVYLFQSEILDIPLSDADKFDQAQNDALAEHEARSIASSAE